MKTFENLLKGILSPPRKVYLCKWGQYFAYIDEMGQGLFCLNNPSLRIPDFKVHMLVVSMPISNSILKAFLSFDTSLSQS